MEIEITIRNGTETTKDEVVVWKQLVYVVLFIDCGIANVIDEHDTNGMKVSKIWKETTIKQIDSINIKMQLQGLHHHCEA